MNILKEISNAIGNFMSTDAATYTVLCIFAVALLLAVIYMIRFRIFTVWHEALFLRRAVNRANARGEAPVLENAPGRIARFNGKALTVERITGRGVLSPKGSFYITLAFILAGVGSLISFSVDLLAFYFVFFAVLLIVCFAVKSAYKALDDACNTYNALKCNDMTSNLMRIVEAMEALPDTQRTVYTLKEMIAALAHAQATAEADRLDELVDRYCHTMNECMLDQLNRMGEVLQDTIDSQNELRKSMRLLLNDLAAARINRS